MSIYQYLPKENDSVYPYKDLYVNIDSSLICNSLKLVVTIKRCMGKPIVVKLYYDNYVK